MTDIIREHFWACWWLAIVLVGVLPNCFPIVVVKHIHPSKESP